MAWKRWLAAAAVVCSISGRSATAAADEAGAWPHSAMTASLVARLRGVLASGSARTDVFAKVGDSNTANWGFMRCLAAKGLRLDGHADLEATRTFFGRSRAGDARTSFDRTSAAATIGWLTHQVLAGPRAPLDREIDETRAGFAIVMLGTNDNRPIGRDRFELAIRKTVDRLLERGVVPVLTTIPPRTDDRFAAARVPALNDVIRDVAARRQIPLVDLHSALDALPRKGLTTDGIHLATHGGLDPKPCDFSTTALRRGMNLRNLLTLQALDRLRHFVVDGAPPEAGDERSDDVS